MAKKNAKEKAVTAAKQREWKEHPFGPPEDRAKGFNFPSPNPTLFVHTGKPVTNLPQNPGCFCCLGKAQGWRRPQGPQGSEAQRQDLGLARPQLCKHEYIRLKAEEKPESKKTTKKEGQK